MISGSGSGSKFNCAARVGSGQTISGTGRVRASVEPVQTSTRGTSIIVALASHTREPKAM